MPTEKEFSALEQAIGRLSHEYDVFLYGTGAKLPLESRHRVEDMIRSLSNQKIDAAAERFRLNTIVGRFSAQCERWERAVRDKEEGRMPAGRPTTAPAATPNVSPAASVKPPSAKSPDQELFERYREARNSRGEDVSRLSFEKFRELLAGERQKLLTRTGKSEWEFDLAADAGRVRLVARPRKGKS